MSNSRKYCVVAVIAFCVGSMAMGRYKEVTLQSQIDEACEHIGSGTSPDPTKDAWVSVVCGANNDGKREILIGRTVRRHREDSLGFQNGAQEDGIAIGSQKAHTYHIEPW